jgi:hypothetical protein
VSAEAAVPIIFNAAAAIEERDTNPPDGIFDSGAEEHIFPDDRMVTKSHSVGPQLHRHQVRKRGLAARHVQG